MRLGPSVVVAWVVVAAVVGAAPPASAQSAPAANPATACLDRARDALESRKFDDAADAYLCAADETAKRAGGEPRASLFRGLSHLARAWALYHRGVTGTAGQANLDEALRQVESARSLFARPGTLAGFDRLADGWRFYFLGIKAGLQGFHAESRQLFQRSGASAMDVRNSVPPLRAQAEELLDLTQDQVGSALLAQIVLDRAALANRGGEVDRLLAELKERADVRGRAWYTGLEHLYRGIRLFDEAGARLESWDYQSASRMLDDATHAFADAADGGKGITREMLRAQFAALVDGWAQATKAEVQHGAALKALLENGDPGSARGDLVSGLKSYAAAQASFEKAGFSAGSIAEIRTTSNRLRERAEALGRSFGVGTAMWGVGRIFFVFFVVTLLMLVYLRARLKLGARLLVTVALVVAIISAFGLQAPKIIGALSPVLNPTAKTAPATPAPTNTAPK